MKTILRYVMKFWCRLVRFDEVVFSALLIPLSAGLAKRC